MQIPEVVYVKKRFAVSGGWGGRPDGRVVKGAMGFEWMERAVEGRKEIQDGKAVSKYNLDVMDEGRSPMEGRKEEQDGKAVSKYNLDAMDEGRAAIS